MLADLESYVDARFIIVLDAYFGVGGVVSMPGKLLDVHGNRSIVTRAKNNAVGYEDPSPKTTARGRPRK
jgi:hypothetical protein